jgi:hypothetical protein
MTDKNIMGNTNVEKLIAEMLDQAMLDPYMLDFLKGYERGVNDSLNRTGETLYHTFKVVKKEVEFPALIRCFESLEHRMVRNLLVVKADLLRF